ncbi:MAG: TRAP transporter small permease [Eubacteriales bacterium]
MIFDKLLEGLLSILMIAMAIIVLWQVFTRFVLSNSSSWSEEAARFLMVWIAFLGGAVGIKYGVHIGLDLFYRWVKWPIPRLIIELFAHIACIVFASIWVVQGYLFMQEGMLQDSPAGIVSMGVVYAVIPLAGIVVIINSIDLIIRRIAVKVYGKDIPLTYTLEDSTPQ